MNQQLGTAAARKIVAPTVIHIVSIPAMARASSRANHPRLAMTERSVQGTVTVHAQRMLIAVTSAPLRWGSVCNGASLDLHHVRKSQIAQHYLTPIVDSTASRAGVLSGVRDHRHHCNVRISQIARGLWTPIVVSAAWTKRVRNGARCLSHDVQIQQSAQHHQTRIVVLNAMRASAYNGVKTPLRQRQQRRRKVRGQVLSTLRVASIGSCPAFCHRYYLFRLFDRSKCSGQDDADWRKVLRINFLEGQATLSSGDAHEAVQRLNSRLPKAAPCCCMPRATSSKSRLSIAQEYAKIGLPIC